MPENQSEWFVYIVRCADDSLYTGIATDVERRLREHNGEVKGGAKYTRARQPVNLIYQESLRTRSEASKRECEIKKMGRAEKLRLIDPNISSGSG